MEYFNKKYKSFFKYKSSEGTGEEAMTDEANEWEFFEKIHAYASKKDNYHPPFRIDSQDGILCMQEYNTCNTSAKVLNFDEDDSLPSTSRGSKARTNIHRIEHQMQRRDKKIGRKISSLLAVFGQMVQSDYPHIDASSLLMSSESDSD